MFITRMDGDKPVNEGLCIKCAKEMNIQPVIDLLDKMGITDEQLDAMDDQMMGLIDSFGDSFDMGGAQSMPFMQMFNMQQGPVEDGEFEPENELDLYDESDGADNLPDLAEEPERAGSSTSAHERRKQEKERKKYGLRSARKREQFSKR